MKGRDMLLFVILCLLLGVVQYVVDEHLRVPFRLDVHGIILVAGIFTIIAVVRDQGENDRG